MYGLQVVKLHLAKKVVKDWPKNIMDLKNKNLNLTEVKVDN